MTRILSLAMLFVALTGLAANSNGSFSLTLAEKTVSPSHAKQVTRRDGSALYVREAADIPSSQIAEVTLVEERSVKPQKWISVPKGKDFERNRKRLKVQLTPKGIGALHKLSTSHQGQLLILLFENRVLLEMPIVGAINGDTLLAVLPESEVAEITRKINRSHSG